MSERPTVLLVDDHAVVRAGIRMLLESQADVTVVAEPSSAQDATAVVLDRDPDVIVTDLSMEGIRGAEVATLLYLSPRTVESHRANLQRKLGVRSRADLVRAAAEIEESESRTEKEDGRSHPRPP